MKNLTQSLAQGGWGVQGASQGGERTAAAAGTAEVRYADAADAPAAQALAQAVMAFHIISRPIKPVPNNRVDKGTLEVWISR